ncbi:hypothetical protein [Simiduia agarivorans]|uniref:Lipoprotein n=1 Tax=Simiduia agarivorans (strain DSM 21679 / JCM 13881 / BCRC 17597 / SA1) TaxID=1117647 RepID=K4KH42_SIMAS|nr:hypothetical protein [Simiduia agarivorans]AFU98321.1 hypothetical protein M5M_05580 [Simiduia agarivorans SA1 = DSM 21679]
MRYTLTSLILMYALTSCAKYQLLPDDTIDDAFDNTKQLYDEHKLKKSGAKKRQYSIELDTRDQDWKTTNRECIALIQNRAQEQSAQAPVIVKESSKYNKKAGLIRCEITAFIWPVAN